MRRSGNFPALRQESRETTQERMQEILQRNSGIVSFADSRSDSITSSSECSAHGTETPSRRLGSATMSASSDSMGASIGGSVSQESYTPITWGAPIWTDEDKTAGHIESECGRYMISKYLRSYSATARQPDSKPPAVWLGPASDVDAAKGLCERHARGDR